MVLPKQFAALERFVVAGWALPAEADRWAKRVSSRMEDIHDLYDSMLPLMDDIMCYLNQYSLAAIPEPDRDLFYLALAFMDISPAVEIYGTPDLPDNAFEITRMKIHERPYGWA